MRELFVDPAVMLLAVGGEHPDRDDCRGVLALAAEGKLRLHMSVEGGQEFLFHRLRRTSREQAVAEFDALDSTVIWHDFDVTVLRASRALVEQGHARGRDAAHAATAQSAGFSSILSTDADFDGIPGLNRLHPAQVNQKADNRPGHSRFESQ